MGFQFDTWYKVISRLKVSSWWMCNKFDRWKPWDENDTISHDIPAIVDISQKWRQFSMWFSVFLFNVLSRRYYCVRNIDQSLVLLSDFASFYAIHFLFTGKMKNQSFCVLVFVTAIDVSVSLFSFFMKIRIKCSPSSMGNGNSDKKPLFQLPSTHRKSLKTDKKLCYLHSQFLLLKPHFHIFSFKFIIIQKNTSINL